MKSKRHREHLKRMATGIMVALMALLLMNNSAYLHVHVMHDGSLVSHAHPFDKQGESKPGQAHHHKQLECQMLQDLQLLFLLCLSSLGLLMVFRPIAWLHAADEQLHHVQLIPFQGRAPPV
jgi:hypothetical protein